MQGTPTGSGRTQLSEGTVQASHREEDNLVPSDTNLFVWKNDDGTYSVQGVSYGGLVSPLWDVNESDLPEKIKSELASAKEFSPVQIDLKENEDIRQWTEVQFVKAYNEGRLFSRNVNNGNSKVLSSSQEPILFSDNSQKDKYMKEQVSQDALRTLRDGARRTFLGLENSDRQIPLNTKQNSELEKLNINRKVDGKYTMTAIFNGTAVTRDVNASTVQSLKNATPDEKVNTVAQIFNRPELKDSAITESVKERVTEAVAQVTQTATPESVSRPEIYASKTEHVSDMATNMQSAASASYNDIQQQQQSQEQSRTRSEGLGM